MADINSIPQSPSSTPSNAPSTPNVVDIATNALGQRIEKTTEGVVSQNAQNPSGDASNTGRAKHASKTQSTIKKIPSSEEELIKTIRQHLEEQIESIEGEVELIKKQGGKGMAFHLTEKIKELRKLHSTIRSLYEVAKNKLIEIYKSLFKVA